MSDPSTALEIQAAAPPEWIHAEEELEVALASLNDHVNGRFDALFKNVKDSLLGPLSDALRVAHRAHEMAIENAGLDLEEDSALVVGEALWNSLRTYRDSTAERIIEPLRAQLEALDIGQSMNELWSICSKELADVGSLIPPEIIRTEPESLYELTSGDHVLRRMQKAGVRASRSASISMLKLGNRMRRLFGRPQAHAPARSQRVPLLHLANYHIRVRLEKPLRDTHEALSQHLSRPLAHLEHALTGWLHDVLEAEWALDRPEYRFDPPLLTPQPGDSTEDTTAAFQAIKAVRTLRALLQRLSEDTRTFDEIKSRTEAVLLKSWKELETEVLQIGSIMLAGSDRKLPTRSTGIQERSRKRREAWASWHKLSLKRIELFQKQIELAIDLESVENRLIQDLLQEVIHPAIASSNQAIQALLELHEEADQRFNRRGRKTLSSDIEKLLEKALAAVDARYINSLIHGRPAEAAKRVCERCAGNMQELITALPEALSITALQRIDREMIDPGLDHRKVPLRRIAEHSFDALLIERVRTASAPLKKVLTEITNESGDISSVLRFNLESATEELIASNGVAEASPIDAAKELTLGGLQRSVDAIENSKPELHQALLEAATIVGEVCAIGWRGFHERLSLEGRLQEQFADTQTRLKEESRKALSTTQTVTRKWSRQLRGTLRIGQRRTEELIRLGQTALGVADSTDFEKRETLDALIEMDALLDGLPLVYRRLFSFRPVTDPALLVGRNADLDRVRKHVAQWKTGRTNALLLVCHSGGGLTSFLNVLRSDVLRDMSVHTIDISERWETNEAFATKVVEALELDPALTSLADIRHTLLEQPQPDEPVAIAVEHLEHLLLRKVGGMNLVERVLTFMSRTDSRILWIVTISDYGWQMIEKTEAAAASLVTPYPLAALNRDEIEALILNRHRRSGIPHVFDAPEEPSPLLGRKLRKAISDDAKQDILQASFFDLLAVVSGPNVMLALLYWLRSIQLDNEEQIIHVRPIRTLSFAFLDQFNLSHAFTLKAFLEHASLTLKEHSEIFYMSEEESLEIFEALGNCLLIQPIMGQLPSSPIRFNTIEEGERYRIRPVLIQPVTQFLRGKNIVY